MPHTDIDEYRAYQRKWKRENRGVVRLSEEKRRRRNREYVMEVKLKLGCSQCGFNSHPAALDFDHIDPQNKKMGVSQLSNRTVSIATLDKEMAKCIVLCANCHRIKSSNDLGYYKHKVIGDEIVWDR